MKERSVTSRNLVGGFFGGLLGILFFKLVYPLALPMGCIIGVVAGYLYQEIWRCIYQNWKKSVNEAVSGYEKSMRVVAKFQTFCVDFAAAFQGGERSFSIIIRWCARAVKIIFPFLPVFLWLKTHPMNRAYFIQWSVAGVFIAASVDFGVWAHKYSVIHHLSESKSEIDGFIIFILAMLWLILTMSPIMAIILRQESDDKKNEMAIFYREYERYSRLGALKYALGEILRLISFQIFIFSYVTGVISYALLACGLFLVAVVIPISAMIGSLKGIYYITCKAKPWLCLGITLTVTIASAWPTHSYLDDVVWLWIVALATGTVSGLASEGVRRLIATFFIKHENFIGYATSPLWQFIAPYGRKFWSLTCWLGEKIFIPLMPVFVR